MDNPNMTQAPPVSDAVAMALRLTDHIFKRREEFLSKGIKPKPRTSIWASQIPDCERQGVYEFLNWKDKKLHDYRLEALFQAGRVQEEAYRAQLREIGIELVEDGAPISDDIRKNYGINGYLDWRVKWEGRRVPFEAKMVHPNVFARIRNGVDGIEDMNRMLYMRKYVRQGTVYLLGTNEPVLVFAFTDGRGNWTFPVLELDYVEAERILKIAERIRSNVAANTYPDRIEYDPEVCGRCAFAHICIPDIVRDAKVKVLDNAIVADLLERRDALYAKAKEFEKIDKTLKAFFLGVKEGVYTLGNFIVSRTSYDKSNFEVPDDIKEKYRVDATVVFKNDIKRFSKPDPETIYLEPKRDFGFDE